mmetsp:Transcript_6097/g.12114  ORF Transcript_6097/g.12114 Transcript_6097/m.12114 type:complete len:215 (+) Transcript_6097:644-1288(+)
MASTWWKRVPRPTRYSLSRRASLPPPPLSTSPATASSREWSSASLASRTTHRMPCARPTSSLSARARCYVSRARLSSTCAAPSPTWWPTTSSAKSSRGSSSTARPSSRSFSTRSRSCCSRSWSRRISTPSRRSSRREPITTHSTSSRAARRRSSRGAPPSTRSRAAASLASGPSSRRNPPPPPSSPRPTLRATSATAPRSTRSSARCKSCLTMR